MSQSITRFWLPLWSVWVGLVCSAVWGMDRPVSPPRPAPSPPAVRGPSVVPAGALVQSLTETSPNRGSGLRPQDIITHVAATRVTTYAAYRQALEKAAAAGTRIQLIVRAVDDGPPRSVTIRHGRVSGRVVIGIRLRFLEPGLWVYHLSPGEEGVLRAGDLITHVDGKPVADSFALRGRVTTALRTGGPASLTVRSIDDVNGKERVVRLARGTRLSTIRLVPVLVDTAQAAGGPERDDGVGSGKCVRSLFVLLDNDPTIGETVRADYALLSSLFQQQLKPSERASRVVLRRSRGQLRNREMILDAIRGFVQKVRPDDTVLIWYSGHGAFHRESRAHLFTIDEDTVVRRDEVMAEMRRARARLTVLVSDCCATITRKPPPPPPTDRMPGKMEEEPRRPLAELLLKHRGVVDINSCSPGQAALSKINEPGLFTLTFADVVRDEGEKSERFLTWETCFRRVKAGTSAKLGDLRRAFPRDVGDAEQVPYAFTPLTAVRADTGPAAASKSR